MSGKVGGVEAKDRFVLLVPEQVRSELLRLVPGLYSECLHPILSPNQSTLGPYATLVLETFSVSL